MPRTSADSDFVKMHNDFLNDCLTKEVPPSLFYQQAKNRGYNKARRAEAIINAIVDYFNNAVARKQSKGAAAQLINVSDLTPTVRKKQLALQRTKGHFRSRPINHRHHS